MTAGLRILAPGLLTTVQDLGRPGFQRFGVPVSGALDSTSLRAANIIVGNPEVTAALEIAYQGPSFEVLTASVRVAAVGADAPIELLQDGGTRQIPSLQSVVVNAGQRFRLGALRNGTLCYLAIEGGIAVPPLMGSRSTYARAGFGGFMGRALKAGDILELERPAADARPAMRLSALDLAPPPRIRVMLGPQDDYFTAKGIETLLGATWTVSRASDRMGMRLDGPPLEHDGAKGYNIVSDGIAPGAIQVPGDAAPIILLSDRQTTGGYPKIATVISADLPALGRLQPGSKIAFAAVAEREARAARLALEAMIRGLSQKLEPVSMPGEVSLEKLHSANLVSGVVHGEE